MANGSYEKLEARYEALHAEFNRRSEERDRQLAEYKEAVSAQIGDNNAVITELATKVAASEKAADRTPSWLQIVVAAGTLATILAGLAAFTLDMTIAPIEKESRRHEKVHDDLRADLAHYQSDVTSTVKITQERQDDVRNRLARMEGQMIEVNKRIDDIDKIGPRRNGN